MAVPCKLFHYRFTLGGPTSGTKGGRKLRCAPGTRTPRNRRGSARLSRLAGKHGRARGFGESPRALPFLIQGLLIAFSDFGGTIMLYLSRVLSTATALP